MRIDQIEIENVLGVRRVDLALHTPVTLVAGGNAAGKSSLIEAVRMALGDDPQRVALKKEYGALVSDGARKGAVAVRWGQEESRISLPDGKRAGLAEMPAALPFVLEPTRFARLDADARRTFLFRLTGCQVNSETVRGLMLARQLDEAKVDKVLPLLRNGFPAAADFAKAQARDAKAAWKAITGEQYGEKKADGWTADKPQADLARIEAIGVELETLDKAISAANTELGTLTERQRQQRSQAEAVAERGRKAARLPVLRQKLAKEEAELSQWNAELERVGAAAGAAPRNGLVHDLATAVHYFTTRWELTGTEEEAAAERALMAYEQAYGKIGAAGDPAAAAQLPKVTEARNLIARAIENTRRDIAAAEAAAQAQAEEQAEPVADQDIELVRARLNTATKARKDLEAERQRLDALAVAARQADEKTKQAAQHHGDVTAWLAIEAALAPDGIPGELLAKALKPMNDRLRASATATGWKQAAIGADMAITADGRPYPLLSESERWRVNAMVAEAISHLSGLRLLALDGMDVLEISARGELIYWLDDLATAGELETALVFATLKGVPGSLPETVAAYWLDAGEIVGAATARAAA